MMPIFTACQRFSPQSGDAWSSYIEWSGLRHIEELVSMDSILCPSLIDQPDGADWDFNIHADYRCHWFHDYKYLKLRVNYDPSRHNLLAISECPTEAPEPIDQFTFCGYDVLDGDNSVSVLTNCGGFPEIFSANDLNQFGLITDLGRVTEIAETIRLKELDYHCCDCRVWGIARYSDIK